MVNKIIGKCRCGHAQHEHADTEYEQGHGACLRVGCSCTKFTWTT